MLLLLLPTNNGSRAFNMQHFVNKDLSCYVCKFSSLIVHVQKSSAGKQNFLDLWSQFFPLDLKSRVFENLKSAKQHSL